MATPYVEEFGLISKNNEAISQVIVLRQRDEFGVLTPIDLTGREFLAQARRAKSPEAELMCDISVTVQGDPTEGTILLSVSETVIATLAPGKGHFDLLTRASSVSHVDNLFMAPFIIEGGVTKWQS